MSFTQTVRPSGDPVNVAVLKNAKAPRRETPRGPDAWFRVPGSSYFVSTAALLMTARPSCVLHWKMTLPLPSSHISVVIVSPG